MNVNFLGGIIGDVAGSVYEWHNAQDKNDILFFKKGCRFTDDTVLTCAVMDWLVDSKSDNTEDSQSILKNKLRIYGNAHPGAGYGSMFRNWLNDPEGKMEYPSFGNGSGMRCSGCGFVAKTYDEALILAKNSALPTHGHIEGIKGAQAIAGAIWLARNGENKNYIKHKIGKDFEYNLKLKADEVHDSHPFDATCQVTVPEAIAAFLESNSFEDCFEKAIWIGGDSDTIADMACAIAGAYYGIPSWHQEYVMKLLPEDLKNAIKKFDNYVQF